ncbi:MAG: hypothetical protein HY515_02340 [Candidatus Aenigmarchaeota archaeon]|nr:hypothetical protein [Candidatus Aenigmarchaeota archaeon]
MTASDQPRFLFWLAAALIIGFAFYSVSMLLLPRLIRFNQLPETGDLYVDNADVLATRIAYGACALWQSKNSFNNVGFDSTSQYKSTSGSVGQNEILTKLADTDCKDIDWQYKGDTINADKKTYDVTISLKNSGSLIEINVKRK